MIGTIRISNHLVTHWVNGVIVVQYQLYSDDWDLTDERNRLIGLIAQDIFTASFTI